MASEQEMSMRKELLRDLRGLGLEGLHTGEFGPACDACQAVGSGACLLPDCENATLRYIAVKLAGLGYVKKEVER